ncbi:hypothetical protein M0Q97_09995 [Candidatus Dojkabacteria bacterium]|jgi:hypothetical protein|nr:hypothetical protein [Candidatus Dojkabacteria bacterium]
MKHSEIVNEPKQKRHRRTKAEMKLVREIDSEIVNDQPKQKRHRRTKAEMKLVREIDVQPKQFVHDQHENNQPKQKRYRRTKAEMELIREIDTKIHNTELNDNSEKIKQSNVNESVKLKFDHKGIPKDTILEVIETPQNQIFDEFYIWIKYNDIIHRILKFNVFFVR